MRSKEHEPTEPRGDLIIGRGLFNEDMSKVILVMAMICMCISEAFVIRGLWFNPNPSLSYTKRFVIPLEVFLPCLLGFAMYLGIKRMSKVGQISLPEAANMKVILGMLLMVTYLAISHLVEIAFG